MTGNLKTTYAEAPADIRIKAPLLRGVLILLVVLSVVVIGADVLDRAGLGEFLAHGFLFICTVAALYGLQKGRYREVSNGYFSFMVPAFALLRMIDPIVGSFSIPLYAAILGSFLVFGSVFIANRTVLFGLIGFYVASYAGYSVFLVLPKSRVLGFSLNVTHVAYASVAVVAISIALLAIRFIFDRVMATAVSSLEESQHREEKTRKLAESSANSMAKSGNLLEDMEQTRRASQKIEANTRSIEGQFSRLNDRMNHAALALGNVKEAADTMDALAHDQAVQVERTGTAVEQMAASIESVSDIITKRTAGIQALTTRATEGETVVHATLKSFGKVRELLDAIRDTAAVISDIAERTNLLAMNASIEAAHAGDAGRGFAVVAGEIRNLSASTSQSAGNIADTIAQLVSSIVNLDEELQGTGGAIRGMSEEIKAFASAIEEIGRNTEELKEGSREILGVTTTLGQMSTRVNEQAAEVRNIQIELNQDFNGVAQFTSEIAEDTKRISGEIASIRTSIDNVGELAAELENESRQLFTQIGEDDGLSA